MHVKHHTRHYFESCLFWITCCYQKSHTGVALCQCFCSVKINKGGLEKGLLCNLYVRTNYTTHPFNGNTAFSNSSAMHLYKQTLYIWKSIGVTNLFHSFVLVRSDSEPEYTIPKCWDWSSWMQFSRHSLYLHPQSVFGGKKYASDSWNLPVWSDVNLGSLYLASCSNLNHGLWRQLVYLLFILRINCNCTEYWSQNSRGPSIFCCPPNGSGTIHLASIPRASEMS